MNTSSSSADRFRLGLLFAVGSALSFGVSGPLAKPLMTAGWSPAAAVLARLAIGAAALAIVATIVKPDWLRQARTHARIVVAYGLAPVAGAQLCYFNAVAHLSVGVALLLEYTAPVLVVAWVWATTGRRPGGVTLAGVALAVVGVALVLDVASGARIDAVGVAWGLAAAVCLACYFVMSGRVSAGESGLHPITLAAGSLLVATVAVAGLGITGALPIHFSSADAVVGGLALPWFVPVALLGVVATAVAYLLGICGVARLRPSFASLMGLAEVLFAVLAAWLLLGERLTAVQGIGAVVVLLGLALARRGERGGPPGPAAPDSPDAAATVGPVPPEANLTKSKP